MSSSYQISPTFTTPTKRKYSASSTTTSSGQARVHVAEVRSRRATRGRTNGSCGGSYVHVSGPTGAACPWLVFVLLLPSGDYPALEPGLVRCRMHCNRSASITRLCIDHQAGKRLREVPLHLSVEDKSFYELFHVPLALCTSWKGNFK